MRKYILTGTVVIICLFVHFFTEIIRPIAFLSDYEKNEHANYKFLAARLHTLEIISADKDAFPSRNILIKKLVSSGVYSEEEIGILADLECQSTNFLYDNKVLFWNKRKRSVSYTDAYFRVHLVSIAEFESLKREENH